MIRAVAPLLALCALLLAGLGILLMGYRLLPLGQRLKVKQKWSMALLRLCGIRVRLIGDPGQIPKPSLMVLNHISWLDIFVVNACLPSTFIAKSEIRGWPLVGWLVAGAGTVFVERKSRHAVGRVNREIRRRLDQGERIAFFPEGTTSVGKEVLAFHSSLFAAALDDLDGSEKPRQSLPVVPMALRFCEAGMQTEKAAYVGSQTLIHSIIQILLARGMEAQLTILEPIMPSDGPCSRQALAQQAHRRIADALLKTR